MSYSHGYGFILVPGRTHPLTLAGIVFLIVSPLAGESAAGLFSDPHHPQHQEWGSSLPLLYIKNIFFQMPRLSIGGAEAAMTFVEAMPGSGAPRASLLLSPNGKYTIRVAPGAAAKAARQLSLSLVLTKSCFCVKII